MLDAYLLQIKEIQEETNTLPALTPEQRARLWSRIRLDWNYHSNAIEGNTLPLSETHILLTQGIHAGNKLGRHYEEMRLHDQVLDWVKPLIKQPDQDDYRITERLIRELHALLMGEEYTIDAEDAQGNRVQVKGRPGNYKTDHNYVHREGGEQYYYSAPKAVPREMHGLVQWLHDERQKNPSERIHPVEMAGFFHLRFVTIHPFDDGNGRIGRLLMNIILMQERLAPAIIQKEECSAYIAALVTAQTEGGEEGALYELIAKGVLEGMNLRLKAYKGESLRHKDDWKKEAQEWQHQLEIIQRNSPVKRSHESVERILREFRHSFLVKAQEEYKGVFEKAFETILYQIESRSDVVNVSPSPMSLSDLEKLSELSMSESLKLNVIPINCKIPNIENSYKNYTLELNFHSLYYSAVWVSLSNPNFAYQKRYDEFLTQDEIDALISFIGEDINRDLQEKIKQYRDTQDL